jgi:hypothetical protein
MVLTNFVVNLENQKNCRAALRVVQHQNTGNIDIASTFSLHTRSLTVLVLY